MDTEKLFHLSENLYVEATERCANFNAKFLAERKNRLPYLDSQTGVVQNSSSLWKQQYMRLPGKFEGQIYSYPEKRWKRAKKEQKEVEQKVPQQEEQEMPQLQAVGLPDTGPPSKSDADETATIDAQSQHWYDDDQLSEKLEVDDVDNFSDGSDYDDYVPGRKKKSKAKGRGGRSARKKPQSQASLDPLGEDKPYGCHQRPSRNKSLCPARYKTRPGLNYHYTHVHGSEAEAPDLTGSAAPLSPPEPEAEPPPTKKKKRAPGERATPNEYCDFCLKDANENKNGEREELCGCADCGRAGHPSCLQFTANMCISVKQYPWQCIECKSCGVCGTSDNDDQLLFCDDCDRGYHMYCLNPPLSEAPEGNWSCLLCIAQFYGGKKPPNMA